MSGSVLHELQGTIVGVKLSTLIIWRKKKHKSVSVYRVWGVRAKEGEKRGKEEKQSENKEKDNLRWVTSGQQNTDERERYDACWTINRMRKKDDDEHRRD